MRGVLAPIRRQSECYSHTQAHTRTHSHAHTHKILVKNKAKSSARFLVFSIYHAIHNQCLAYTKLIASWAIVEGGEGECLAAGKGRGGKGRGYFLFHYSYATSANWRCKNGWIIKRLKPNDVAVVDLYARHAPCLQPPYPQPPYTLHLLACPGLLYPVYLNLFRFTH